MDDAEQRTDLDADVAVVGYGPVGSALAILLAERGHQVLVLERQPQPYPLPRAVHFDHETARILQACGLGDRLADISEPADVYEWRNGSGVVLLRLGREGLGLCGWPESSMFNQPELEAMLDAAARAHPEVTVRRGAEVVGLADEGAAGVRLDVVPVAATRGATDGSATGAPRLEATGPATPVRARYVVGCDGANSMVRTWIDPPIADRGFFYDWLVVDLRLHEPRTYDPINLQICDPARPTTLVSGGPGRRRWEFMRLPDEPLDELHEEATAWRLLAPWDVHPDNATLERHAVYRFQARWVESWRGGPVLVAGDAAHQTPPFAGQGMCAGLCDVVNLAWKLDLVLRDEAPDALLDAYGAERAPNMEAVVGMAIELGKVICVPDPDEAAARDAAMAAAVPEDGFTEVPPAPGIDTGIVRGDDPEAGRLFVQGVVSDGAATGRFDDLVGAGFRLIARPGPARDLDDELVAWFARIGGRVVTVGPAGADGDLVDAEGTYTGWFDRHHVAAVLQRPDFHLFGSVAADAGPGGLDALVADLRDALLARPGP